MSSGSPETSSKFQAWQKKFNHCWTPEALAQRDWRGKLKALWRVVVTTCYGIFDNRLSQQAAALTYYSLMSLGPILALALTISGFILSQGKKSEENPVKPYIVEAIHYVSPQIVDYNKLPGVEPTLHDIDERLDSMVDQLVSHAANGQAGVIGLGIILVLTVMMIGRVEDALNGIWGVKQGRSWRDRFSNYLLFIILFFLIGAATITVLSIDSLMNLSADGQTWIKNLLGNKPWAINILNHLQGYTPRIIALLLLGLAFTVFNRLMPNARVRWSAAFVGGLMVGSLILLNHHLASLYVNKVSSFQSLYGSLSIVLVLMFGSYLTWFFVLIGGQLSYAFQNRWALARHKAWEHFSHRARRTLSFISVAETLRRYNQGVDGPTTEDIAEAAHVPSMVVVDCLKMLCDAKLLVAENQTHRFKPARPLDNMTVGELWALVDLHSHHAAGEPNLTADPAGRTILEIEKNLLKTADSQLTLGELAKRA
jgi:membrane protein